MLCTDSLSTIVLLASMLMGNPASKIILPFANMLNPIFSLVNVANCIPDHVLELYTASCIREFRKRHVFRICVPIGAPIIAVNQMGALPIST